MKCTCNSIVSQRCLLSNYKAEEYQCWFKGYSFFLIIIIFIFHVALNLL